MKGHKVKHTHYAIGRKREMVETYLMSDEPSRELMLTQTPILKEKLRVWLAAYVAGLLPRHEAQRLWLRQGKRHYYLTQGPDKETIYLIRELLKADDPIVLSLINNNHLTHSKWKGLCSAWAKSQLKPKNYTTDLHINGHTVKPDTTIQTVIDTPIPDDAQIDQVKADKAWTAVKAYIEAWMTIRDLMDSGDLDDHRTSVNYKGNLYEIKRNTPGEIVVREMETITYHID